MSDLAFRAEVLTKIKLGRVGQVEDLLGAILLLASDASAMMTGTSLVVMAADRRVERGAMRIRKVTSHEVARLAGVSQTTVSRAFNREGSVSEPTSSASARRRTNCGYWPNELARSLIRANRTWSGSSWATLNPFYPAVLHAFTQKLQTVGRHVLLFSVPAGADVDAVLPQMLHTRSRASWSRRRRCRRAWQKRSPVPARPSCCSTAPSTAIQ